MVIAQLGIDEVGGRPGQVIVAILTDGLENAPDAFLAMLSGGNVGKALVRIGDDPS